MLDTNTVRHLMRLHPGVARRVPIPTTSGVSAGRPCGAGVVVSADVSLGVKAVAAIRPAHEARLHTYLGMSGLHVGLILNFNARPLTDGIRRYVV